MKKPSHKKAIGLNQYKKAIGIDVCNGFVNVVSLERNFGKVSIVGHSRIAIKESAGGNGVENLKSIASAVKKSGLASYIRHSDAGMCLSLSPELLQILNLPDSSPDSAMRFIHDEIKQYAVLPLKNIKMDYCALRAAGSSEQKRVLVGASPAEPLGTITKEFEKDYLDVRLIEPAVVALIRACYNKVIKPARQSNVMLVLLRFCTLW